ncbi:protein FAM47E-like isoform X2 [Corticium candelabrum]|uniref:protein FAM47E-like isoform X2 n=1 Tax=Corticium candelabrum TaxID=121492 RepID=UPI002E274F26|nr:protein FAM47E-like isoform X2 [Corticium candelabrum]
MAEHKYDLLLVSTKTERPPRRQPWYKERLRTKVIKTKEAIPVDSSEWRFIGDGGEDFRTGVPLRDGTKIIQRSQSEGIQLPLIQSSTLVNSGGSARKIKARSRTERPRFSKEVAVFSKTLPGQQRRQDYVNDIEDSLVSHPLGFYPHLQEAVSSDLFDEVMDILDPEVIASDSVADELLIESPILLVPSLHQLTSSDKNHVKRPSYRWRPQSTVNLDRTDGNHTNSRGLKDTSSARLPSPETRVHAVTAEFCEWVKNLGDNAESIDEATVHSLFASGYETKPSLSVPIHVVELLNVPAELRLNKVGTSSSQQLSEQQSYRPLSKTEKLEQGDKPPHAPSWVERGRKYGAWYLPTSLWQQRSNGVPLRDPKEADKKAMSVMKKRMEALDTAVGPLHGAQAFREFIHNKNRRMPRMLSSITTEDKTSV